MNEQTNIIDIRTISEAARLRVESSALNKIALPYSDVPRDNEDKIVVKESTLEDEQV